MFKHSILIFIILSVAALEIKSAILLRGGVSLATVSYSKLYSGITRIFDRNYGLTSYNVGIDFRQNFSNRIGFTFGVQFEQLGDNAPIRLFSDINPTRQVRYRQIRYGILSAPITLFFSPKKIDTNFYIGISGGYLIYSKDNFQFNPIIKLPQITDEDFEKYDFGFLFGVHKRLGSKNLVQFDYFHGLASLNSNAYVTQFYGQNRNRALRISYGRIIF